MKKCDFCTKSSPDGKCFWNGNQIAAESDCEDAIRMMVEAMKHEGTHKKTFLGIGIPPKYF